MTVAEIQTEALCRARSGKSLANWPAIFRGFIAKGIPESDILPRENVFGYRAWQALDRQVRKGEHGVSVFTWVPTVKTDRKTGEKHDGKICRTTTVFHVSQTDKIGGAE